MKRLPDEERGKERQGKVSFESLIKRHQIEFHSQQVGLSGSYLRSHRFMIIKINNYVIIDS